MVAMLGCSALRPSARPMPGQVKRCKTDSSPELEWDNPERPEATNLLTIYQLATGRTKVCVQVCLCFVVCSGCRSKVGDGRVWRQGLAALWHLATGIEHCNMSAQCLQAWLPLVVLLCCLCCVGCGPAPYTPCSTCWCTSCKQKTALCKMFGSHQLRMCFHCSNCRQGPSWSPY